MKKQFFRVKQLADQTFLRADKTEVLNHEELQVADHKVEYLRGALSAISKRIPSVAGERQEPNIEKRMKKYPEYQLGIVLSEQGARRREPDQVPRPEDDCSLFQSVVRECGQAEQDLAKEQAEHEIKVEQMVSSPLQQVLDNDLPNILKQKRNLNKYILDKDSASSRYNASKNGNQREALKDDLDEADTKVEQSRDVLAAEMFSLLKKENELSQYILQLLKLQRGYHESALKNLEKIIPELERRIGDSSVKAVFGINLEEHLRVTSRRIAYPLELCVCALTELGMSEEGLFRVAGGTSRVKRLKLSIDAGCFKFPLIPEYRDVHVIASTLKSYLRELPEPLLTYNLYNDWMSVSSCPEEHRLRLVQETLRKLPTANIDNLTYLVRFLARLTKHPENKMNSSNIAIVIAPNLLWNSDKEQHLHMSNCTTMNLIVEMFVNRVDELFPEDLGPYITLTKDILLTEEEFHRPHLKNVRLTQDPEVEQHDVAESPKPQSRRKAKPAPTPPTSVMHKTETELSLSSENDSVTPLLPPPPPPPSAPCPPLETLSRTQKVREWKTKTSVGVNTDESAVMAASQKRKSLVLETDSTPKTALVNLDDKPADHRYVSQAVANIHVSKGKPVQSAVVSSEYVEVKPTAAPRTFINNEPVALTRTSSVRNKSDSGGGIMSKSLNDIDADVQLRKSDPVTRPKPEVPMRPASLRGPSVPGAAAGGDLHTTKVYSIQKHQPSIVNLPTTTSTTTVVTISVGSSTATTSSSRTLGHDTQFAEKEKFLGHQPRPPIENKFDDVNSNTNSNRNRTSSVGKNTAEVERTNGNNQQPRPSHHLRTRSDGNLIEFSDVAKTPPSPRSISKPTLPPPPPPVLHNKAKTEGDSTDL